MLDLFERPSASVSLTKTESPVTAGEDGRLIGTRRFATACCETV
jgi:hypothetical protein